jgi:hypothetical protein
MVCFIPPVSQRIKAVLFAYIYTYRHKYMDTYILMYIHTQTNTFLLYFRSAGFQRLKAVVGVHIHTQTHTHIHTHTHTSMWPTTDHRHFGGQNLYYAYTHMHTHSYARTHTHTHKCFRLPRISAVESWNLRKHTYTYIDMNRQNVQAAEHSGRSYFGG